MRNDSDVSVTLVALEKPVSRFDFTAFQCMPLRVEDGVPDLERLMIETMRESALLLQRLKNYERHSVVAWPRTLGRRIPQGRANAS
jgi:hypothetical protein